MDYVSILRKMVGERALVTYDRRRKFICLYVKNKKVLDVGCVGRDWRFAESTIMLSLLHFQLTKCARETAGIDLNTKGLVLMKKRYASLNLFAADAYNLPFKDETYDLIVASDVLEHLDNAGIFLDEINRVLTDNGSLVGTVPNAWDSTGLISLLFRIQPTPSKDSTHVHIFDDWTLSLLFLQHNFEVRIIHLPHEHVLLRFVEKFIPKTEPILGFVAKKIPRSYAQEQLRNIFKELEKKVSARLKWIGVTG